MYAEGHELVFKENAGGSGAHLPHQVPEVLRRVRKGQNVNLAPHPYVIKSSKTLTDFFFNKTN